MKLMRGVQPHTDFSNGVVATIGTFDGVHLGHQNLIRALADKAARLNVPMVLILFEPQPREFFQNDKAPARLSSLREKLDMLKKCQVDYVYCIKFNEALAQTSASDFAKVHLFSRLQVRYLLVGEDFRFGKNREGDVQLLKTLGAENNCEVQLASDFCIINEKISSTKIRQALQQGDLSRAAEYLGRVYSLCGRVVQGQGRGRQWGIPTANLSLHRVSLPLQGVFVVQVKRADRIISGVANVGKRPTVDGTKNILEVHLFDFNETIYGEMLQVFFLHKVRDEVKFTSVEALISQIRNDIEAAKQFFATRQELNNFVE
ncbi:MAG: bifunctional riboflavin kinase/FAD synthetase [Bacteroidia bacterium]